MRPRIDWDYHWPRLLAHVKNGGRAKDYCETFGVNRERAYQYARKMGVSFPRAGGPPTDTHKAAAAMLVKQNGAATPTFRQYDANGDSQDILSFTINGAKIECDKRFVKPIIEAIANV